MNTMIRKITGTTILLLLFISATATAQLNIGFVNTQEVLSQMPERDTVAQQMNEFLQEKQEELQRRSTEFQQAVSEFRESQSGMTDQQIQRRNQELGEMEVSLQRFQQQAQQEVEMKQAELLGPIFGRIDEAIRLIAEENSLDFVLNETTTTGDNIVFYASDATMDVTALVIERVTN